MGKRFQKTSQKKIHEWQTCTQKIAPHHLPIKTTVGYDSTSTAGAGIQTTSITES